MSGYRRAYRGRGSALYTSFRRSFSCCLISILIPAALFIVSSQRNTSHAHAPKQIILSSRHDNISASPRLHVSASAGLEYLWYEAENMRGFGTKPTGEPIQNPSWMNLPRAKAPGWGMNGPGVSAEWSQGGESEWNSAAASADETAGKIYQDVEIPRPGNYKIWVRYADWANKTEPFVIRITGENCSVMNLVQTTLLMLMMK